MAKEIKREQEKILVLTKQEATNIIGLLAAQLADRPMSGNHAGACPTFIVEAESKRYYLSLIIEPEMADKISECAGASARVSASKSKPKTTTPEWLSQALIEGNGVYKP